MAAPLRATPAERKPQLPRLWGHGLACTCEAACAPDQSGLLPGCAPRPPAILTPSGKVSFRRKPAWVSPHPSPHGPQDQGPASETAGPGRSACCSLHELGQLHLPVKGAPPPCSGVSAAPTRVPSIVWSSSDPDDRWRSNGRGSGTGSLLQRACALKKKQTLKENIKYKEEKKRKYKNKIK